MRNPRILYMAVTDDKYELPLYVCDSSTELSRWLGRPSNDVLPTLIRSSTGMVRTKRDDLRIRYLRIDSTTGEIIVGRIPKFKRKWEK